jgi:hypothetical protein
MDDAMSRAIGHRAKCRRSGPPVEVGLQGREAHPVQPDRPAPKGTPGVTKENGPDYDGSVDVYFAARAPAGQEADLILTREAPPIRVVTGTNNVRCADTNSWSRWSARAARPMVRNAPRPARQPLHFACASDRPVRLRTARRRSIVRAWFLASATA